VGYWNKDWKPGPFPQTAEERERAAKKYGLRPEDYKPFPDDGTGHGDYPMLPEIAEASRNPFDDYDIPNMKRNYGEPVCLYLNILIEDTCFLCNDF
jgi:NADH dehydrogenase (ubiquinone) 1 beta subcomplex subunit 8